MISLRNVSLQRGTKPLFSHVDVTLHPGQRVGVTGANGSGKSSLFALLRGELSVDSGELEIPPGLAIAHVKQETPAVDTAALDYVLDGDQPLRDLEARIATADEHTLGGLYAEYEAIDGYTASSRAARLLHGLGFADDAHSQPVKSFSGGWRMRLNLAQALMCRSDLLLLDEPTNHLDLEAVIWLEQWLRGYPGTLLLISHDREFLDRVINRVWHIEQQSLSVYNGNYSEFERYRAEKLAQQQAAFEKQQKEMAHLQKYIDRFRAKATKARQAQSRIKALERMERISAAHVDSQFHFDFLPVERVGDPLLKLEKVTLGYAQKPLLQAIDLQLRPGSRIGLLGPNGAGKSTLIKALAGRLEVFSGERLESTGLKIGYFAQHQLEQLDPAESALTQLQRLDSQASEQALRNFLGGFGFQGDRVTEAIEPFSGGEKSRLALAIIVWQRPNLLLLDEPTNHLDLEMRLALTLALQGYAGALVIVSHDRHLLRTCTDELYIVHQGRCEAFNGDLDDYRKYITDAEKKLESESLPPKSVKRDKKAQRKEAAEKRKQLQPLTRKLNSIEKTLDQLQGRQAELETRLSDTALYTDTAKQELQTIIAEKNQVDQQLREQEEQWLNLSHELETLSE